MSFIKSIFVIATILSCFFGSVSSLAANNKNPSNTQTELVTKLPNGKKQLKKKLSLDYTHPKFETDLNQDQKNAILKSLKKWKGELPSLLSLDKFFPINA